METSIPWPKPEFAVDAMPLNIHERVAAKAILAVAARQGWHKHPAGWLVLWALCFLIASLISTPLNLLLSDGHSGVALGDAAVDRLAKTLPLPVASYLGEAAIDLPDKLIAVVAATLVYRGLPQAAAPVRPLELDLSAAFGFVFRSERWLAKLSVASVCLLLSWLLIPFFLLAGYAVAVARNGSQGRQELPTWDRLGEKLKDGFLMSIVFLAWNVPPLVVSLFPQPLVILGNLLGLLVVVLQPAIWSQYLSGGFRGAFDVAAVARRARFNLGLTLVVGALGIVVPVLGLLGLVGLLVGVVPAVAYAGLVVAFLFGEYELITRPTRSEAVAGAGSASAPE